MSDFTGFALGDPRLPRKIWDRIIVVNTCWFWCGLTDRNGYGTVYFNRRNRYIHRVVYLALSGPTELELDHLCRIRNCCNPAHLEPVTHAENMRRGSRTGNRNTHCVNGHEFTPENTTWIKDSAGRKYQRCRTCSRAGYTAWRLKHKPERAAYEKARMRRKRERERTG